MRKKEETLFLYGEKFDAKKAKEYFDEFMLSNRNNHKKSER